MGKTITHEEFIRRLKEKNEHYKNGEFIVIGTYKDSASKIECECPIHGPWSTSRAGSLLKGSGCPSCSRSCNAHRKTHEDFLKDLYERNARFRDGKFEVVGRYTTHKSLIECKCPIHGNWKTTAGSLLSKNIGCPRCSGRNKTTEEFLEELKERNKYYRNGEFTVVEEYKGATVPITCECPIHGKWDNYTPSRLLLGKLSCPVCSKERAKKKMRKTHEEFLIKADKQNSRYHNGEFNIIGEYKDSKTPIECECPKHGKFTIYPGNLLRGCGCIKCSFEKKSHEDFIKELFEKNDSFKNGNFKIIGQYINSHKPIECECPIHGPWSSSRPNDLLRGGGCPECANAPRKTHEEFIFELYEKNEHFRNGEFRVISVYAGYQVPIKCECPEHGEFETLWYNLQRGTGCPKCAGTAKKTHEEFIADLYKKNSSFKNNEFKVNGTYVNDGTPIECECPVHGPWYSSRPNQLLRGMSCPKCGNKGTSFGENYIRCALQQGLPEAKIPNRGDRKLLDGKEIDVPVYKYNFAIEYGSWHWHKDRWLDDYEKFKTLRDKGIKLFTIYDSYDGDIDFPEDFELKLFSKDLGSETNYITLKEIVKSYLKPDIFENIDWDLVKENAVKLSKRKNTKKAKEYIGQTNVMKNGKRATIINYKNAHNIDVQFEDGIIRKGIRIDHFKEGSVAYPKSA